MSLWLSSIGRGPDEMLWTRDRAQVEAYNLARFSNQFEYANSCVEKEFSTIYSSCKDELISVPECVKNFIFKVMQGDKKMGPEDKVTVLLCLFICAHRLAGKNADHVRDQVWQAHFKYPLHIIGAVPNHEIDLSSVGEFSAYEDIKNCFSKFEQKILSIEL